MILSNAALTNTFGLQVRASQFVQARNLEAVRAALQAARASAQSLLVLGGGSNFLFTEPQLNAFVIQPALTGICYTALNDNDVLVSAAAGEVWHQLVLATLEQGLCGLENLALIPGSVGAAPIQNIGAYGVELADCLISVQAMEIASGNLRHFHKTELQLGYRDSVFKRALKDQYIITEITLLLHRQAPLKTGYESLAKELAKQAAASSLAQQQSGLTARQVAEAVMAVRRARLPDPTVLGNAGSFFKNPVVSNATANVLLQRYPAMPHYPQPDGSVKLAAGWLIEQAGMKGIRRGQAGTHESQALVIVNLGAATGADVLAVAREVRDTVQQQFGVTLEPEVWIVGATL